MKKLIKTYVRNIINEQKAKKPGAGIIVVKRFNDNWKVLALRLYGKYDIPKGHIENGESPFEAALRETEEEASITDLNFKWGLNSINARHLTLFLAETEQDCVIQKNPETNQYEHHGCKWVTWDEMMMKVYPYLIPVLKWAQNTVKGVDAPEDIH